MGQAKVKRERIQAVLDAAARWCHNGGSNESLIEAVELYEAIKKESDLRPELPKDPNAFVCPHCGAESPQLGFHFNMGEFPMFLVQWLIPFCGECKGVLGVATPVFAPKPALVEELKRAVEAARKPS